MSERELADDAIGSLFRRRMVGVRQTLPFLGNISGSSDDRYPASIDDATRTFYPIGLCGEFSCWQVCLV
jgi:hypothetical protein